MIKKHAKLTVKVKKKIKIHYHPSRQILINNYQYYYYCTKIILYLYILYFWPAKIRFYTFRGIAR